MLRMTKLTDYGFVLLSYLARNEAPLVKDRAQSNRDHQTSDKDNGSNCLHTSRGLAEDCSLPLPVVGKILKQLTKAGILTSTRGVKGGYGLARKPSEINAAEVISALEGPIAITQCSEHTNGSCDISDNCEVGGHWQQINSALYRTLEAITLAELTTSRPPLDPTDIDRLPTMTSFAV